MDTKDNPESEAWLIHDGENEEKDIGDSPDSSPSFDDLRKDLLSRLDAPVLRSKIRSQIRAALALHLAPQHILVAKSSKLTVDPVRELANAVVAQHLASSSCDFTLSVFLPESMLNPEVHPLDLSSLLVYLRVKYPDLEEQAVLSNRSLLSLLVSNLPTASEDLNNRFEFALHPNNILKYGTESQAPVEQSPEESAEFRSRLEDIRRRAAKMPTEALTSARQRLYEQWNVLHGEPDLRAELLADEVKAHLDISSNVSELDPKQLAAAFKRYRAKFETHSQSTILNIQEELSKVTRERDQLSQDLGTITQTHEEQVRKLEAENQRTAITLQNTEKMVRDLESKLSQHRSSVADQERILQEDYAIKDTDLDAREREVVNQAKTLSDFAEALQAKENNIQNAVDAKVHQALQEAEIRWKRSSHEDFYDQLRGMLSTNSLTRSVDSASALDPKSFLKKLKSELSRLYKENQKLKDKLANIGDSHETEKRSLEAKVSRLKLELRTGESEVVSKADAKMVRELNEKLSRAEREVAILRREKEMLQESVSQESARLDSDKEQWRTLLKAKSRKVEMLKQQLEEKNKTIDSLNSKINRLQNLSLQAGWMISQNSTLANLNTSSNGVLDRTIPQRKIADTMTTHSESDDSSLSLRSIINAKERIRALEKEATSMQQHFVQYRRLISDQFNGHLAPSNGLSASVSHTGSHLFPTRVFLDDTQKRSTESVVLSSTPPATQGYSGGDLIMKNGRSLQRELEEAERKLLE